MVYVILLSKMKAYGIIGKKRCGQRAMFCCNKAKTVKEAEEMFLPVSGLPLQNLTSTAEISVIVEVIQ